MLEKAKNILDEFKAEDVQVLTMPDFAIVEHMIVASGTSTRHLWTMAEKVIQSFRKDGVRGFVEGDSSSQWVVLDMHEIIIHLFIPEVRVTYDLESLWLQRPEGNIVDDSMMDGGV
ncbi:MAG: ribosome silencing factor [Alphaproteobacteria bacterium]|nr:ribosome silencing factor [Alphaproteobacteria bacterium]